MKVHGTFRLRNFHNNMLFNYLKENNNNQSPSPPYKAIFQPLNDSWLACCILPHSPWRNKDAEGVNDLPILPAAGY